MIFNELLVKDGSASIHYQNIQKLTVEMFKVSSGLIPDIINQLFQFREQISYELRQSFQFQIPWFGFNQFLVVQKALNFLGRRYGH